MYTLETRLKTLERAWQSISAPTAKNTNRKTLNPREDFLELMRRHLNEEELKDVAFMLDDVDYDSLAADGKDGKARELFLKMERNSKLYELADVLKHSRPDVDWPMI